MNTSCNRILTSTALANEHDVQKAEVHCNNSEGSSQRRIDKTRFKKRGVTIYTDELELSQCISTIPDLGSIIGFKVF